MRPTKHQQLLIAAMSSVVTLFFSLYLHLFLRLETIIVIISVPLFLVPAIVFWIRFIRVKYYEKHSVPVNGRVVRLYRKGIRFFRYTYFAVEFKFDHKGKSVTAETLYLVWDYDVDDVDFSILLPLRYIENKNRVIIL